MTKELKFVYGMVGLSLLLVAGFMVLWKVSSDKLKPGKSGTIIERTIDRDIDLLDADGKPRGFKQLEGKVSLVSHVFTRCPSHCAGLGLVLDEIRGEFEGQGPLHLVSVSLDPEHDTPAQLKDFSTRHELLRDNWWFVTGEPEPLNRYMADVFLLAAVSKPEEARTSEFDLFDHQPMVAMVGHDLRFVGWYYPFDEESAASLRKDLKTALDAAKES